MKKTIMKSVLAATMLLSTVLGQEVVANAATAATAKPTAKITTVKPTPTPKANVTAPIMRDNLSKYGLKKVVDLPVTVTAGGLSYTLEKIMIYDFNSKDAIALRQKYKYGTESGLVSNPKYFIWTKITLVNNSKKTVDNSTGNFPWLLQSKGMKLLDSVGAFGKIGKVNDKEALTELKLKPGQSLSTYQAFYYADSFEYFVIRLFFNGSVSEKYITADE